MNLGTSGNYGLTRYRRSRSDNVEHTHARTLNVTIATDSSGAPSLYSYLSDKSIIKSVDVFTPRTVTSAPVIIDYRADPSPTTRDCDKLASLLENCLYGD